MQATTISSPASFVAPTVIPTGGDLRRIRLRQGWSVGQAARRAHLHRATVHRIEVADPRVSDRARMLLAAALGLEVFPPLGPQEELPL